MAKFTDIPDDILSLILDCLSRYDFNALVRVNRRLNEETVPRLYREIKFEASRSRGCARGLAFLLRTLLERPQLASHVNSFKLRGPLPCWTKYNPWPPDTSKREAGPRLWGLEDCTTLSRAQKIFASNQFYQLVDESMHKAQEQFKGRNKDALATLVLTRCHELTTLELCDGFLMHSLFLPQILKRADQLLPKLSHVVLGDKRMDPGNSVSYMDLDLIRPIFYSPSVSTFEYTMSQPWQLNWSRPQAPRSESLTTLHLFRTNINRGTLEQLLYATPCLKRFQYDQEVLFNTLTPGAASITPYLNLDGLNIALSNLKNTLEECRLTLSMAPGSLSPTEILENGLQFPGIQGTLSYLHNMPRLTKVEVPAIMFLGWAPDFAAELKEVLPPGLTHLTLRDDFVNYCPWAIGMNCHKKVGRIGEYLEQRAFYAKHLQSFRMRLRSPGPGSVGATTATATLTVNVNDSFNVVVGHGRATSSTSTFTLVPPALPKPPPPSLTSSTPPSVPPKIPANTFTSGGPVRPVKQIKPAVKPLPITPPAKTNSSSTTALISPRHPHPYTPKTNPTSSSGAGANTWLRDAVRDLGMPLGGAGVKYWVKSERRAEVHCWRFGKGGIERKDSIIPGMFPST